MKFRQFFLVSGLFLVVFFSSMAGYIFGTAKNPQQNTGAIPTPPLIKEAVPEIPVIKSASEEHAAAVSDFTESYVLREDNGKVSLFIRYANGDEELHTTYDSPVSLLPENDREALRKGIVFDSISDALQLAEDYAE